MVWFRWFSFSRGLFSDSMLIFQGVKCWDLKKSCLEDEFLQWFLSSWDTVDGRNLTTTTVWMVVKPLWIMGFQLPSATGYCSQISAIKSSVVKSCKHQSLNHVHTGKIKTKCFKCMFFLFSPLGKWSNLTNAPTSSTPSLLKETCYVGAHRKIVRPHDSPFFTSSKWIVRWLRYVKMV